MKNYKTKIALFLVGLTTLVSCNKIKDFGDTNVNPADITSPATYAILTGVIPNLVGWVKDGNATVYIQYNSETQYPSEGLYNVTSTYFGFGTYTGTLLNLKTIMDKSSNPDEIAVARILTQFVYWHLTDGLGDIPYSQALKGTVPAYDKQQDIYKGMIAELKAAKAQFINGGGLKGDILNNNSVPKWIKFANSLRAMMAIQLSKRYPGAAEYAATEFRAAIADGVIDNNADNIKLDYPTGQKNPYWADHDGARDNGESVQLYTMLNSLADGRQAAFGSSNIPVPYGLNEGDINNWIKANVNWSRTLADEDIVPNSGLKDNPRCFRHENSPVFFLTASQLFMARAEAAERGWTTEDATSMMTQGINASFAQWNLTLPPASYFTQSGVVLNGTNNMKKIAEQAYLASFPNGRAGWNIWRRLGYPVLTPSPAPLNPAHVVTPRRYTFIPATASTFSEYSLNPAGVASSIATLVPAGDLQENRVWWDQ
jgi:hypothetical protein